MGSLLEMHLSQREQQTAWMVRTNDDGLLLSQQRDEGTRESWSSQV